MKLRNCKPGLRPWILKDNALGVNLALQLCRANDVLVGGPLGWERQDTIKHIKRGARVAPLNQELGQLANQGAINAARQNRAGNKRAHGDVIIVNLNGAPANERHIGELLDRSKNRARHCLAFLNGQLRGVQLIQEICPARHHEPMPAARLNGFGRIERLNEEAVFLIPTNLGFGRILADPARKKKRQANRKREAHQHNQGNGPTQLGDDVDKENRKGQVSNQEEAA